MRQIVTAALAAILFLALGAVIAAKADSEWPPSFARVHLVPDTLGCDGDKLSLYPHWKTAKPSGPDARPIVIRVGEISSVLPIMDLWRVTALWSYPLADPPPWVLSVTWTIDIYHAANHGVLRHCLATNGWKPK